ncbi:MAG: nitroreductase family protein [Candidatus Firestonebacteria bacterium]
MNFIGLVKNRYSCRKFADKNVEREKLELCLEAARLAPSACNSQPWKFIVIDDPALKEKACKAAFSGPYASNAFGKKAPVLVVVLSEKGNFTAKMGTLIRDTRFYLIDLGAAVEHFILQAAELGLGTCWMGWFNETPLKKVLGLPKSAKIDIIVPVGYPDQPLRDKVRKPKEEIRTFR